MAVRGGRSHLLPTPSFCCTSVYGSYGSSSPHHLSVMQMNDSLVITVEYTASSMGTRARHRQLSDIGRYVMIRKLLDPIFNMLSVFIRRCEIHIYTGLFFHNVAYTKYEVYWFVEQIDFTRKVTDFRFYNSSLIFTINITMQRPRSRIILLLVLVLQIFRRYMLPPPNSEVKNGGAIPPLPDMFYGVVLN
jgi:hypothetical protein